MEVAEKARRMGPEQRRSHLIATAFAVFAERPYEEIRLEDIAAAAGVRRSLIYHYFPAGKPDLFAAVFREAVTRAVNAIDSDPDRSLEAKISANLRTYLDLAERDDPSFRIYREGRRLNNAGFQTFLADARAALATEMAFNHLGTREPGPRIQLALEGFVAFFETVIETWADRRDLPRAEVEELLGGVLLDVVARARH